MEIAVELGVDVQSADEIRFAGIAAESISNINVSESAAIRLSLFSRTS